VDGRTPSRARPRSPARGPRVPSPGTPGCDRYRSRGRVTGPGTTVDAVSIQDTGVAVRTHRAAVETTVVGRARECARLEQDMRRVRAGQSAVLVLRGGPGIGKTALLDVAARSAQGCRVVRARGVESERQFPYAGLQLVCLPLLDTLGRLQPPQRAALRTAVGASTGPPPDPFMVGLATLDLLSHAAEPHPLLCVIDDAQWLDRSSAQALAFVSRRLGTQPVMILLAARDTPRIDEIDGLPELRLGGLPRADARTLFRRVVPGRVDPPVVERIIAEARGNPLALLEYLRAISPADLAGGFGVTSDGERWVPIEDDVLDRVGALPPASRQLLLAAAAEPLGDPSLLWRAAARLGVPPGAAEPLEYHGLLEFGPRVTLGRPLLRLAVCGLATNEERRGVHRALASATDPASDPARHAWHLALAADGPDEELARELERCSPRARERGGPAAAAAFLERATLLTLDPGRRAERALTAAAAEHEAGNDSAAVRLLLTAELGPLDERGQARLERQRAQVAAGLDPGDDVPGRLMQAARQLEPLEPGLARETYLEALAAAVSAGRLALESNTVDVAKAAHAGPPAIPPQRADDRLLDGLVARFTRGPAAAAGPLTQALDGFRRAGTSSADTRWRWLVGPVAADLWDDETWHLLTSRDAHHARDTEAVAVLPAALTNRALAELHFGEFASASVLVDEAAAVSTAMGTAPLPHASLLLAAWRGRGDQALESCAQARREAVDRGDGLTLATAGLAAAVLHNSLGRHHEALAAAREAAEFDDLGLLGWTLVELIEAAARVGAPEAAGFALERLTERTRLSGTEWALGVEARSRALLEEGPAAEDLYRQAIERLGRSRIRSCLARTQLLYGEWLRRRGRRLDARKPLRAACESFTTMGAAAWAERAHRELLATGEKVRNRSVESSGHLTPQEARIALMACDGLSNPAIGARIFVSPRTVEYHLHKVFSKLGITSRTELHLALPAAVADAAPPLGTSGRGEPPTRPTPHPWALPRGTSDHPRRQGAPVQADAPHSPGAPYRGVSRAPVGQTARRLAPTTP
jgi:DNA-binding CsgD family transcriptional regulator/tetratricopeptide (TPR) repeat protein